MSAMKKWEHLQIPFENVKEATKDFEKLIGKGGYGEVYEGQLLINGMLTKVAVKRLNERSWQGLKEFLTEIDLLSGKQHQNIITLVGYCDQGTEKIIVYEYAEHGSLDQYIRRNHALTWLERLRIVIGVARGLDHLHNHLQDKQLIIHRDIKCSNILLDHNWVAKISDLGLSKLTFSGLDRSTLISHVCGTLGYVEPEYVRSGFVSKKTDVYSFGMVLFEVLCGRLCIIRDTDGILLLPGVAIEYYENNQLDMLIDPVLREQMSQNSLTKFSTIAYKCLQDRENRPYIDVVLKELEETLEIQLNHVYPSTGSLLDSSRHQATHTVSLSLTRVESPLRKEASVLRGLMAIKKWLDGIRSWKNPITTVLVHILFFFLVTFPDLILPIFFLYLFIVGILDYIWFSIWRRRNPPHVDTHLNNTHPDALLQVVTVVGDLLTQGERLISLLSWRDPRHTTLFVVLCLLAFIVFYAIPFQPILLITGFYVLRHPRLRRKAL